MPRAGRTLACPKEIPFGTNVLLDGKWYVCEDRGSKIKSFRFDVFMGTDPKAHNRALEYGVRLRRIYFRVGGEGTTSR